MREVHYNGGMVIFSVPDSWNETTHRGGGAAYFEGSGEDGSLYFGVPASQAGTDAHERTVAIHLSREDE